MDIKSDCEIVRLKEENAELRRQLENERATSDECDRLLLEELEPKIDQLLASRLAWYNCAKHMLNMMISHRTTGGLVDSVTEVITKTIQEEETRNDL